MSKYQLSVKILDEYQLSVNPIQTLWTVRICMLDSPDTFGLTEGDSKISRYVWKGPEKDIGGDRKKGGKRY